MSNLNKFITQVDTNFTYENKNIDESKKSNCCLNIHRQPGTNNVCSKTWGYNLKNNECSKDLEKICTSSMLQTDDLIQSDNKTKCIDYLLASNEGDYNPANYYNQRYLNGDAWESTRTKDICSNLTNVNNATLCKQINQTYYPEYINVPDKKPPITRPDWLDNTMVEYCKKPENKKKKICSCINSISSYSTEIGKTMPQCVDISCNDPTYKPEIYKNEYIRPYKTTDHYVDCKETICRNIVNVSDVGGEVYINNLNQSTNCPLNITPNAGYYEKDSEGCKPVKECLFNPTHLSIKECKDKIEELKSKENVWFNDLCAPETNSGFYSKNKSGVCIPVEEGQIKNIVYWTDFKCKTEPHYPPTIKNNILIIIVSIMVGIVCLLFIISIIIYIKKRLINGNSI